MRGALSVVLAYAFVLQLLVAGLAFERSGAMDMAMGADGSVLCMSAVDGQGSDPSMPQADHSVCCALCASHSPTPLLPAVAGAGMPVATDHRPGPFPLAGIEGSGRDRREPRSSQGPPMAG